MCGDVTIQRARIRTISITCKGLINRFGWAVVGVEGDRIHPPWAYTLGLTSYGRPELVVTGLPAPRATWLLNEVASYVLDTAVPCPGEEMVVEGGPSMEVVRVTEPTAARHQETRHQAAAHR